MDNLSNLVWTSGTTPKEELSLRELSQKAKVPYTTARRIVLENKSLFSIKDKSGIKLISLNLKDRLTKSYLIIAERKKKEQFLSNKPLFKTLTSELISGDYCLVLFGSRAAGNEREKSDLDLCIINKNGKKNLSFSSFEMLYHLKVNPLFFTPKEFTAMLKEEEVNVGKEILKKHVVLYGEDYFWGVVWNGL